MERKAVERATGAKEAERATREKAPHMAKEAAKEKGTRKGVKETKATPKEDSKAIAGHVDKLATA